MMILIKEPNLEHLESPCSVSLMRLFFDYWEIEQNI